MIVIDASALLAVLRGEPGSDEIAEIAAQDGAVASAVNVAEAIARLVQLGATSRVANDAVVALLRHVEPFNHDHALLAAELREPTMHRGLSLADRACIATAIDYGAVAVTTDRTWEDLDVGARIRVIR